VPLRTQLAEAKAQIDAYAENVIRGEIAAEALKDTIDRTSREVAARRSAVERERGSLASLKASLEARATNHLASASVDGVPAQPGAPSEDERRAVRRARDFRTATTILERRESDLEGLRKDYDATMREVAAAKAAQARLAEEVTVLHSEIAALEARATVAQTRKACDAVIDKSGYGEAQARLESIRTAVREQNKRLEYYAMKADALRDAEASDPFAGESAIDVLGSVLDAPAAPVTSTADAK
jgi:phage shock protein A